MFSAPAELAARPQWVAWRLEQREGKNTKIPYNARTGSRASSTDPHTWATFEEASSFCARHNCEGVGYVLSPDDPYVGIDLDHCRNPDTAQIQSWAKTVIRRLSSYTEISPSGTGIRIFVRGTLPARGRRKGDIEIYSQARFLTITGDRYLGAPDTIQDRSTELAEWHTEVFGEATQRLVAVPTALRSPVLLADADLLLKARSAANGSAFWALWNGDWNSSHHSQSEADLALLNHLAFWTGPDPARLDGLFRASGLMREKWERADYRSATIDKALSGRTEFYGVSTSPQLTVAGHTVDPVTGEVLTPAPRFRFLSAEEVKNRPPPEWSVDKVLQANTVALLVGAQETYKSFVGLDMAMCTAHGLPWAGHVTHAATTAYISAEGGSGLRQRITAWEIAHDLAVTNCYFLADQAPQFLDRGDTGDVLELINALQALPSMPSQIWVDTLARTMVGGDENSAQDMGLFIASAEQIRQATGATVVLVHHNNRQGSARGSTALLGAVHTIIECSREQNSPHVVIKCGKQKDAEHFDTFVLESKVIIVDEQGRTSLTLAPKSVPRLEAPTISKSATVALDAIAELETTTYVEWREQAQLANTTFREARTDLIRLGFVDHTGDQYTLTEVGQAFRAARAELGRSALAPQRQDGKGGGGHLSECPPPSQPAPPHALALEELRAERSKGW